MALVLDLISAVLGRGLDWLHVIESTGRLSVVPLVARWARNVRANKAWGSLTVRAQERTLMETITGNGMSAEDRF